ncbi:MULTISPECIES: hypothetical protein [Brevibacillus]|uniref:Uncharacterized protein n=1 Tax=Brevibacillus laterosporus LMG 15441 TaxID=1042163 RepID=A0A075R4D5_BRELA|nr:MULTISPECIES: hypothetical protein [Brevibacillus]AIG26326.1 hypothetical protein BRLA_c020050 [Brevibacillus laterosporus LMG 15441]ERM20062.1 hypothetical protein P615_07235 [Brevibacillus laterosporus PE36]MBA4534764.1 hypothetical protein [Brevibacillus halotolerans]MCR8964588.1 hypothetical protein [Brevibacillus laterosporus]MCR8995407.1 hypothetical protein [Brevibacillus laterosporus]
MSQNQDQQPQNHTEPRVNKEAKVVIITFIGLMVICVFIIGWFMFLR